ncbi:hypothetical protein, partial [Thauera aminoaromatica]|uniref:hypothetical protein n=1 Tax=Thauera aminoaromatica TaxID=164330 RepID=UPI003B59A37B|nr:ISAs1 family transposase [Thauera aminoaromatica]
IIRADKTDTRKSSLRLKRKGAAWDDGVRERMLGISDDMLGECGSPGLGRRLVPIPASAFS